MKTLVLIDGHSLAFRAFYALEHTRMSTRQKEPTWAVFGFFNAIFSLLRQVKPDAIAVSFDVSHITFRTEMYPEYKAHRDAMPEELRVQIESIREGVEKLGIPIYQLQGYEADDVIGTLSKKAAQEGYQVQILTGDQDAFQLIEDGKIHVLIPPRNPRDGLKTYNSEEVMKKMGVRPDQVIDFKGLKGDTSDNIPGIPGVGDKTAAKLLAEHQTMETLYANLDSLPANKLKEKLVTHKDIAFLSKKLATIDLKSPIEANFDDCALSIPAMEELMAYFERFELKRFKEQAPDLLAPFLNGQSASALSDLATAKGPSSNAGSGSGGSATATLEKTTTEKSLTTLTQHLTVPHEVVTTESQLTDLIKHLETAQVFSLDIETTGLDIRSDKLVGIAISALKDDKSFPLNTTSLTQETRSPVNLLNLPRYPRELSRRQTHRSGSGHSF